jgi:uncharacterized protein YndB with AHSA1/START domain
MKHNEFVIEINKPVDEVFRFLLDPQNTPKWIDSVLKEETNEWPTKLGSLYRNAIKDPEVDGGVILNEYEITIFKQDQMLEFSLKNSKYHVKYSFKTIPNGTELIYTEWVDDGEIEDPFTNDTMQKLKSIIEGTYIEKPNDHEKNMIELTRYKIKKGKSGRVDEWMKLIRDNAKTPENLATLDKEKMLIETIFREKLGVDEYLYWFHIQGEKPSNLTTSDYEVDKKHLEFAEECTEPDSRVDMKLEVSMIPERIRKILK